MRPTVIARELGIAWSDWRRLAKSDRAFAEVLAEAKAREEEELVETLKTTRGPGAAGLIFLLKARHAYRDVPETKSALPQVNVQVTLPKAAQSVAEYEAAIAAPAENVVPLKKGA